jgi:hypothetical protein
VPDASQWPLFDIKACVLSQDHTRFCFSFDLLIADLWSVLIFFRDWQQLYQYPEQPLPPLDLSFRDYVLAEAQLQKSPAGQADWHYWSLRLDSLPAAPALPQVMAAESLQQARFQRFSGELTASDWQRLQGRAREAGITPSMILCAAYAEVLAIWSESSDFCLNVTLFNRWPMHKDVNQLIGDFTALELLAVSLDYQQDFVTRAQQLQRQLLADLSHRTVNGVQLLAELAKRQKRPHSALMPVVFTSALPLLVGESVNAFPADFPGQRGFTLSQTPQVSLDHQVVETHGCLHFSWDVSIEL